MSQERESPWNSFEVAKLMVSTLIPLLVLFIGITINGSHKTAELQRSIEQLIVDEIHSGPQ